MTFSAATRATCPPDILISDYRVKLAMMLRHERHACYNTEREVRSCTLFESFTDIFLQHVIDRVNTYD